MQRRDSYIDPEMRRRFEKVQSVQLKAGLATCARLKNSQFQIDNCELLAGRLKNPVRTEVLDENAPIILSSATPEILPASEAMS